MRRGVRGGGFARLGAPQEAVLGEAVEAVLKEVKGGWHGSLGS